MTIFCPSSEELASLCLASPFAYRYYQNHPQAITQFIGRFGLTTTLDELMIQALVMEFGLSASQAHDDVQLMQALRQLRQLLMVRWIWQDALGLIALTQLTYELSCFANQVVCFVKDYSYQKLMIRHGEPFYKAGKVVKKDELAIVAMGKLGAGELNLSSDIDLIFIHLGNGQTTGDKAIDNQKFMTNLGRLIIKLINDNTSDGFVFRVDMRLRPWGDGSPLVMSCAALAAYFDRYGRTWERFAWLKARIINPVSDGFAEQLQQICRNFVFRYYVDYSAFSALREMRLLIANQVAQREDLTNVKLGVGGIRDIEFIAQSYALIYGGRYPSLMDKTACLAALSELSLLGLIDGQTADDLSRAYHFLRRLEHAIQARHDTQTQRLPKGDELMALAQTLGFQDSDGLLSMLDEHRNKVRIPFDTMVTYRQLGDDKVNINAEQDGRLFKSLLDDDNQARLQAFWSSKLVSQASEEAKARLQQAYPVIVHALISYHQAGGDVNAVLPRLIALLESVIKRSIYLVMLFENPTDTCDLIPMLAQSPWIAGELVAYPALLDSFLQKRYRHLPNKDELRVILQQSLLSSTAFDDESFLMNIRLFKKAQVLAVATSDVLQHHPIMKVSDSLTFISEVVLETCLHRAFEELVYKHGYPISLTGEPVNEMACGFAVVGYGKLGGIEMSYASDLDVVFLHRVAEQAMTTGANPISGMKFATRLVQKLINYLSTQTRDGRAYELDMRLRPSGNAGVMVISSHAFDVYQRQQAWVWEHQALVRARAICGDKKVLDDFNQTRRHILQQARDVISLKQEVLAMREKMRSQLSTHGQVNSQLDKFHLKQDYGGLVDIEFMAQFCVLRYANAYPDMAIWSDNVRIFEMAANLGVWDEERCQILIDAYLSIRKATHTQALADKKPLVDNAPWQACRTQVMAIWQAVFGVV